MTKLAHIVLIPTKIKSALKRPSAQLTRSPSADVSHNFTAQKSKQLIRQCHCMTRINIKSQKMQHDDYNQYFTHESLP